MLYHWFELGHAVAWPTRVAAETWLQFFNPLNPLTHTPLGRSAAAGCELYERATRRYAKPDFGIQTCKAGARTVNVIDVILRSTSVRITLVGALRVLRVFTTLERTRWSDVPGCSAKGPPSRTIAPTAEPDFWLCRFSRS
jgi:hypothetical protein